MPAKATKYEVLEFIKVHRDEKGYPPTLREIGENYGYKKGSYSSILMKLRELEKEGLIERPGRLNFRAIKVL